MLPPDPATAPTAQPETARLADHAWRRWGPYLSERAWGTVREDYSDDGDAWSYLPHDHARSRAFRWSEDGLGASHQTGWTGLVADMVVRLSRRRSQDTP